MTLFLTTELYSTEEIFQGFLEYFPNFFDKEYLGRKYSEEEIVSSAILLEVLARSNLLYNATIQFQHLIDADISKLGFNYPQVRKTTYHFEFKDGFRVADEYENYYPDTVNSHAKLYKEDLIRRVEECRAMYNDLATLQTMTQKDFHAKLKRITLDNWFSNYRKWMFETYGPSVAI